MRLIAYIDGALEVRWPWFPYWVAINTELHAKIHTVMAHSSKEGLLLTKENLDMIDERVRDTILEHYPNNYELKMFLLNVTEIPESTEDPNAVSTIPAPKKD